MRGSSRSLSTKSDPYLGLLDHDSKSTAKRRSSSSRRSSAAATAPIAILKPSDPISIVHSSTKWICLCCAEIHCFALKDTSNDLKHIFIHYSDSKKQHPIYMNLKTFETWCCACISTIDYSAKQNQVLMEAAAEIRKHVGSSESSNSALDISASSSTASIVAATGKNGQVIAPFTSPGKGAAKNAARNGKFKPAYPGLQNLGNTCFFNSVMQCLTYTKPLKDILVDPYSKFPIIGQLNTGKHSKITVYSFIIGLMDPIFRFTHKLFRIF